jgi:hypothetical protein
MQELAMWIQEKQVNVDIQQVLYDRIVYYRVQVY